MVGFTTISERLAPDALVALLSDFHGRLARITFAHDGTVDKYIGDEIMVHFGMPRPQPDDPVRALACAAEMVAEIRRWNAERKAAGEMPIGIGIGLHYGDVIVGNIGDARRLEYGGPAHNGDCRSRASRKKHGRPAALLLAKLADAPVCQSPERLSSRDRKSGRPRGRPYPWRRVIGRNG